MIDQIYLQIIIIVIGYLFLLATSGKLVIFILSKAASGREKNCKGRTVGYWLHNW